MPSINPGNFYLNSYHKSYLAKIEFIMLSLFINTLSCSVCITYHDARIYLSVCVCPCWYISKVCYLGQSVFKGWLLKCIIQFKRSLSNKKLLMVYLQQYTTKSISKHTILIDFSSLQCVNMKNPFIHRWFVLPCFIN